jgi:hypothetical protein
MAVNIKIMVYWDVTLSGLVDRNQHLGRTCCLHLQGKKYYFFYHEDGTDESSYI